jgi:hypothetical protein
MSRACSKIYIQSFGRKPEGKKPYSRFRNRQDNNIKMDLNEVGKGVWWIYLAQYGNHCQTFVKTQ